MGRLFGRLGSWLLGPGWNPNHKRDGARPLLASVSGFRDRIVKCAILRRVRYRRVLGKGV